MQTQLKPWTGSERLYFYPQSAQIVGQTGQIGRLRIDFGRQGNEFYSTWEDSRLSLKSDKFRQQFDDIISLLRQLQPSVIRLSTSNSTVYFPTASVGGDICLYS